MITSTEIRQMIRIELDGGKGLFAKKLYKSEAIKDRSFYTPSPVELQADYKQARLQTSIDFEISSDRVNLLSSNPKTIWDCDNMARELRHGLNKLHYKRYRQGLHNSGKEYAAFQVTDKSMSTFNGGLIIHDYVMVFCTIGIYFADFVKDKVWSIREFKPTIISIGE